MPNGETVAGVEQQRQHGANEVQVTVDYLPAGAPLHREFPQASTLETVRSAAMEFFGVRDRTERDTYKYYLTFENNRVTDTSQTLEQLLGPHRKGTHFHLVEEITPGTAT